MESKSQTAIFSIGIPTIIIAILAYFIYSESISAMFGIVLLSLVSGVSIIISTIPYVGVLIGYYINTTYTYPFIMNFTHLSPTWLTTGLLYYHTLLGGLVTIVITIKLHKWT